MRSGGRSGGPVDRVRQFRAHRPHTDRSATCGVAVSGASRDTLPDGIRSGTFTFDHVAGRNAADYTQHSRFLLYDNGAFVLEYLSLGGQYRGGYTESNGVITFEWEGWSVAGPWGATGTLRDGLLDVKYNEVMYWTDFEDAVYRLTPP